MYPLYALFPYPLYLFAAYKGYSLYPLLVACKGTLIFFFSFFACAFPFYVVALPCIPCLEGRDTKYLCISCLLKSSCKGRSFSPFLF